MCLRFTWRNFIFARLFHLRGQHEFAGRRYSKKSKLCEEAMAFKFCGEGGGGVSSPYGPRDRIGKETMTLMSLCVSSGR